MNKVFLIFIMVFFLVILSVVANATIFGDVDQDGDVDIYGKDLYINVNGTFFRLVNGSGIITFSDTYLGGIADFNGNGFDDDVYVVRNGSQNRLYINDGTGNFTYDTTYTNLRGTATDSVGFYAGLINNDSHVDLFAGDTFFQWNTTCGCYDNVTSRASLTAFNNMKQVIVVDIVNRSRRDFIGVNNSGTVRYFYNLGDTNGDGVDEFADVALVTGSTMTDDANSIAVANFNPDDPTDYNLSDVYISKNGANSLYLGRTPIVPGIAEYPDDNATSCGVNDAANTIWTATGILDNVSAWVPAPSNLGVARNTTDLYCANVQNDTLYTRNGTLGVGLVAFANRTLNITQNMTVVPQYAEAIDLNGDAYADVVVVGSMYGSGGFVGSYVTGTAPATPPDIIYVEDWAKTTSLQFESIGTVGSAPASDPRVGTSGGPGGLPPGTRKVDECQFTTQIVNAYTNQMIDNEDLRINFLDKSFEFGSKYASVEDGVLTFQMTGPYDSAYSSVRVEFGVPGMSNKPSVLLDVSEAPTDCGPILEIPIPVIDCSGAYLKQIPPPNTVQANVPAPELDITDSNLGLGLGAISGSAIGRFNTESRNRVFLAMFPWNHLTFKLITDPKTPMSGFKDFVAPIMLEARMTTKQMQEIGLEATLIRDANGVNLMAVLDTKDPGIVDQFVGQPGVWPENFPPPSKTIDLPPEFTASPIPIIDIKETPDGIQVTPTDEFGQPIGDPIEIPGDDLIIISEGPDDITLAGKEGLILGTTFVPDAKLGEAGPGDTAVYVTSVGSYIDGKPATGPVTIIPIEPPEGPEDCFGSGTTTQGVLSGGSVKPGTTIDLSGTTEVNFQFGTTGIVAARKGVDPYTENKIFIQIEEPEPELIATLTIGTGFAVAPIVPVEQKYSKLLLATALGLFALLVVGVGAVSRQQKRFQVSLKSVEEKTRIVEDKEDRFN